jgi:hypothetical protein
MLVNCHDTNKKIIRSLFPKTKFLKTKITEFIRQRKKLLQATEPRVEAGKNSSTVIPASRKRRRKGNPVVSGETVPADLRKG